MIRADHLQHDLDVEGEFVTEGTMRDEWKWSEFTSLSNSVTYTLTFWFFCSFFRAAQEPI